MADIMTYIGTNYVFLLGVLGLVSMVVLLRYYFVYGSVDFLIGSGIFLGLFTSTVPTWIEAGFLVNFAITLLSNPVPAGLIIFGSQALVIWCFSYNAISTSLGGGDKADRVMLALSSVGAILYIVFIFVWAPQGLFYLLYRWIHVYGFLAGLILIYYYLRVEIVISSHRSELIIKIFAVFVGFSRFFFSLFEVLWSISRGPPLGIGEQWGVFPTIEFISYNVTPLPGIIASIITVFLILLYPQFFIISQTQILRAKKLYRGMRPAEDDSPSIGRTRISSYLESIPEDFLKANNIQLVNAKS